MWYAVIFALGVVIGVVAAILVARSKTVHGDLVFDETIDSENLMNFYFKEDINKVYSAKKVIFKVVRKKYIPYYENIKKGEK